MRIIGGPKELIARYVARKHGVLPLWHTYEGLALVNADDELVAGCVFHGYVKDTSMVMENAGEFYTPTFIAALMDYVFNKNNCKRLTGLIEANNAPARRFAEQIGGKLEGIMREGSARGGDLCIYGMLRADAAKWLTPRNLRKLARERTTA